MNDDLKQWRDPCAGAQPGDGESTLTVSTAQRSGRPLEKGSAMARPHMSLSSPTAIAGEAAQRTIAAGGASRPAAVRGQLAAVGLHKSYRKGPVAVPVLRGVDIAVERGEFVAIVGQSGSGKSTLLHLLATLDAPDQGEIYFAGERIDRAAPARRDALRNREFGMIFQFYHLLPELSALENVLVPLMVRYGVLAYYARRRKFRQRAEELLKLVGLGHRLTHKPRELSGGEMQRAAIARALISEPQVLLADEPTGNLDHGTGREIIDLLRGLNDRQKLTIVMVTHDQAVAAEADRMVRLVEGRIADA